jgi:hypothetical protein
MDQFKERRKKIVEEHLGELSSFNLDPNLDIQGMKVRLISISHNKGIRGVLPVGVIESDLILSETYPLKDDPVTLAMQNTAHSRLLTHQVHQAEGNALQTEYLKKYLMECFRLFSRGVNFRDKYKIHKNGSITMLFYDWISVDKIPVIAASFYMGDKILTEKKIFERVNFVIKRTTSKVKGSQVGDFNFTHVAGLEKFFERRIKTLT